MNKMDYLKDVPEQKRDAVALRLDKAMDPQTAPFVLNALSKDPYWFVREHVATNPGTPAGTLADLSYDPDSRVRDKAKRTLDQCGMDLSDYKLPLLAQVHEAEVRKNVEMATKSGRVVRETQER